MTVSGGAKPAPRKKVRQTRAPRANATRQAAQTAAVLVVSTYGQSSEGKLVYFMSIDGVRFRRPVFPGDRLELHVEKVQSRASVWKFSGKAIVEGKVMAEATFAAMIRDKPAE